MAASTWQDKLLKQVIRATIPGNGAFTDVLHRLDGKPNKVTLLTASVNILDITINEPDGGKIPIGNANMAAQEVILELEIFHKIEGDVGMTVSDYTASPITHSHSDGLDAFTCVFQNPGGGGYGWK